jgi:hypothetical protein
MGLEVGLQPMQALQSIAVINGRPSIWGDGALAIVKTHPEFAGIQEDDLETIKRNKKATCIVKRRGQQDVKVTFGEEDAITAGLWKKQGPWTQYPFRMMQMRARSFAIRDQFPDALKGIATAEEAGDYSGPTVEGEKPTATASTPSAEAPKEDAIGQPGGSEFYRLYKTSGWTADEAKAWLRDNLQIGQPHNDKNSKDILVKDKERAFKWARTIAPIRTEVERKFDLLEWAEKERVEFFAKHKDWALVDKELAELIAAKNQAEQ